MNPFNEKLPHQYTTPGPSRSSSWDKYIQGGYYHTPFIPAVTQKARGVFFIMNKSATIKAVFAWNVPKHILFAAGDKFNSASFNYPVFIRPCPTIPRHGFVDSTMCETAEELNSISQETFEEEENAEILITKPIDASYSAILTDGVLTFSGGNDGATSGRDVKYFYLSEDPIAPAINLDPNIMLEGEVPFYELVLDKKGKTNLVQVRSGPGVPKCKDFIPEEVTIKKIIKAEGDLLEWEKLLSGVDPLTTAIDHTNGSLASHYAIHAIINRIPIFTSYKPSIGDVIPATAENTELNDDDREKFYKSFCYGFSSAPDALKNSKFIKSDHGSAFMTASMELALSVLHNFSAIAMAKDYEVVGITLGLFLRATFAVSAGETRYAGSRIKSNSPKHFKNWHKEIPKSRGECYNWMYKKSASEVIESALTIHDIFDKLSWGEGYGGKKWASCTRSTIDLFNACVTRDVTSVVQLFNQVLHEEHNGGRYLNKVINVSSFDDAANNPSMFSLKKLDVIIDLLSQSWEFASKTEESDIDWDKFVKINYSEKSKTAKKPDISNAIGRWKISTLKAYADHNGDVTKVYVESALFEHGKLTFSIKGPALPVDCGCGESTCTIEGGKWFDLSSVPYYWKYKEVKILTKSALNSLIDKVQNSNESSNSKKFKKKISNNLSPKGSDVLDLHLNMKAE